MYIKTLAVLFIFLSGAGTAKDPEPDQPSLSKVIFQSTDNGDSWQDISAGLPNDIGAFDVTASDNEVFLTANSGLYRSSTNRCTAPKWEKEWFVKEGYLHIIPTRCGLYAIDFGLDILRNIPGSGLWLPVYTNLPNKLVHTLLETADGAIFAGCAGGIYKSTDGGENWRQVLTDGNVGTLTEANGILLGGCEKGVLRSTDGGEHWDQVMDEDGFVYGIKVAKEGLIALTDGGEVWRNMGMSNRLRSSVDGGKSWQLADEHLSPARNIFDINLAGDYLFCSSDAGIFRSADLGKTWEIVHISVNSKLKIELGVSGKTIFALYVSGGC